MRKSKHKILDNLVEDFFSVMRTKYSSKYCSIRLNSFYDQKEKRSNDYCSRKKAFDLRY